MLKRLIINNLSEWSTSAQRRPLVLRGARQVGKTVIARLLGEQYDFFSELNMERPEDAQFFKRGLSATEIIEAVKLKDGIPADTRSWLIFIDEIQACPPAVAMLRYFYEDTPAVHVIAAGSLLEVALQRDHLSFPVGRVEFRYVYPMNFEEFLHAVAKPNVLEVYHEIPSPVFAEDILFALYHKYALIGGLPEAVAAYAEHGDVVAVNKMYENLFTAYVDDIPKYAQNDAMRRIVRHCLRTAPLVAGTRIRFAGFGESAFGSRECGDALRILEQVMMLSLVYPSTSGDLPFTRNLRKSPRLQFLDTGLLHYLCNIQSESIGIRDLSDAFRGRLLEQITGQELLARRFDVREPPLFWVRDKTQSQAEVDFLETYEGTPLPVEVKSGPEGKLRSLHEFMKRSKKAEVALRLYRGSVTRQDVEHQGERYKLINIPYYHAAKTRDYASTSF
jgi:predicted AAA+ superfamily ATPase